MLDEIINPDKQYEELLTDNSKYKIRVDFLKEEAKAFVKLKTMIV